MSRIIKFRVWNGKDYLVARNNSIDLNGRVVRPYVSPGGGEYGMVSLQEANDGQSVIEQFIGLEDKNGKEIYEGDIVKACMAKSIGKEGIEIGRINYREDTAGFSICPTLHESPFRIDISVLFCRDNTDGVSGRLEVIGNVHQNPELLKP